MATFLRPVLDEINLLTNRGFSIKSPDGEELTCKVRLLMCSVDLVARAPIMNMKQFNGKYGCCYCEDEGVPLPSTHLHRTWPYTATTRLRTHRRMIANARGALRTREPVKGVKGASILCSHRPFDLSTGMVIDVMHCVFLGVVGKGLMKFWFGSTYHSKLFSLRRKMGLCDERLMQIRVPHDFSRAPRSLSDLPHWKASEYCSWLLYYSLPVLSGVLPEPFFTHYSLLVAGMHILLGDTVTEDAIDEAEVYLLRFYRMYSTLYGDRGCTMNVHLLKHIPDCVRHWGPLWGYSCFPFESFNGHLKRHFHGTKAMNVQLAFSFVMAQMLPQQRDDGNMVQLSDCSVIGEVEPMVLTGDLKGAVHRSCGVSLDRASRFLRIKLRQGVFYSQQYTRLRSRNSYTVCYRDGDYERFGLVQYYLSLPGRTLAVITPLKPTSHSCYPTQLRILRHRIKSVVLDSSFCVISVERFICKCVFIELDSGLSYVARKPSTLNLD